MKITELFSIWEVNKEKNTYVYPNSHSYYELVYYPHGRGVATIGGTTYPFTPNTFFIIPPNIVHDETRHSDCTILCLSFSCHNGSSQVSQYVDGSLIIYKILKEILKESIEQPFDYQKMIDAKLNELLVQIKRLTNSNFTTSKNFEYIINYIKENYHEKIQLSSCAEQLNISYDYFQHKFKKLTGYSPQNFLLEQRLNASKELLKNSDHNCTEIAYQCGFSTSAQFSMLFKKRYGLCPKDYAKKVWLFPNHTFS